MHERDTRMFHKTKAPFLENMKEELSSVKLKNEKLAAENKALKTDLRRIAEENVEVEVLREKCAKLEEEDRRNRVEEREGDADDGLRRDAMGSTIGMPGSIS